MTVRRIGWTIAAVLLAVSAGCGKSVSTSGSEGGGTGAAPTNLVTTTPAAAGSVDKITWALYRDPNSLDPIYAFDYPENTVITAMCDSMLRQQPDGSVSDGLTSLDQVDPTTLVFTIHAGATFWDGKPVTAQDIVYSLERNTDTSLGGFYPQVFTRVASITATSGEVVTIKVKQPDYWLAGELSSMPGIVLEKAYVERQGKDFGTPKGGTMCSGPFKLSSWHTGDVLSVVANDAYWDTALRPQTRQIDFKGVPDEGTLTSGFLTGEIDGGYTLSISTLDQLKASDKLNVFEGPSYASDAFIVSSFKGVLGDARVRQALSLAVDRQGYINSVYRGAAQLPRALANPGTWGYGRDVFQQAWNALPEPTPDLAKAKQLIKDAGVEGKPLVLGTSGEINSLATAAEALRSAAVSIGLKPSLKSVSAQNYINFFVDAKARQGVDGFFTVNYPDYADPSGLYGTLAVPGGSQNYAGYNNPQVTQLFDEARTTADPDQRAQKVAQAQAIISQELPWIPMSDPYSLLVMNKRITGAPASFVYMDAPWAASIGAAP